MQITVLGSLGHIGQHLVPRLVHDGHNVTVVTSSERRLPAIQALGAKPLAGDIADATFLTTAFTGADAVFTMLAGGALSDDLIAAAIQQASTFRTAIAAAGVHNVVQLSSVGADQGPEVGPLHTYGYVEREMRRLAGVNLAFVRPVGFWDNLLTFIPQIRNQHAMAANIPGSTRRAWAAPEDIATTVADLLERTPVGTTTRYVVSDFASGDQIVAALRAALRMPDLQYVELTDDQYRDGALAAGVPDALVTGMVTMGQGQRQADRFYADLDAHMPELGTHGLSTFVPRFVAAYNGKGDAGNAAPFAGGHTR